MKKLKIYILPLGVLFFFLIASLGIYSFSGGLKALGEVHWKVKEKEVVSRLLAVPILLYHNIDGKGPFSIELEVLRRQFQLIRDRNIKVIPLKKLVERLEDPKPYREKVLVITFDDGYGSMYEKLLPLAEEFGYPITLFVYTDFITERGKKSLTWKKLGEMDRSLIDIQCHTISHTDLTKLTETGDEAARQKLYNEMVVSRHIIEQRLGKKIDYFAFPFGRYNLEILSLSRDAGYSRVFSTDYGSNVITRDNFCLRRHHIKKNYSLEYFDRLIQQVR